MMWDDAYVHAEEANLPIGWQGTYMILTAKSKNV